MEPIEPHILFVCTGNTCRSVVAEFLAKRRYPERVVFESAGMRLALSETPNNAVQMLRSNFGIDASAHTPRDLQSINLSYFDAIVAIDDLGSSHIYEALQVRGVGKAILVRWKVEDPFGDDLGAYDLCAVEIQKLLRKSALASYLAHRLDLR